MQNVRPGGPFLYYILMPFARLHIGEGGLVVKSKPRDAY